MIKISIKWTGLLMAAMLFAGCHKDLDRFPPNDVTGAQLYANEAGYKQVLAKVYGSMALTGNSGPAGSGDVAGIDETSLTLFFYDETNGVWSDQGIIVVARDPANNRLTVQISHLTEFAMGVSKRLYLPVYAVMKAMNRSSR